MSTDLNAKKIAILDMFEGFPSSPVTNDTARVYAETVETCTLLAVQKVVAEFKSGRVPDQSKRFAPASPEFAARVRLMDDALTHHAARKDRPMITYEPAKDIDPAMRKKVSGMLLDLAEKMEAKLEDEERLRVKKLFARSNADDMGDPRPLDERLRLA